MLMKSQMRKWEAAEALPLPASLSEAGPNIWGAGLDTEYLGRDGVLRTD